MLTRPRFFGLENVPDDGRVLLIGNHTIYGLLDVPFMAAGLYKDKGIIPRAMGDHTHWRIPLWGELLGALGAVPGTRANCSRLMQDGETILVYPGGSREVNKREGEAYKLFWRERIGFARMAIEHDYPVVTVAAVGAEEMLDVVVDRNNSLWAALSGVSERLLDVGLPSIVRGIGPTPIPRPKRLDFKFGRPIESAPFRTTAGAATDAAARRLRELVRQQLEADLEELLQLRDRA